jgi:hypothetical protein
VSGEILVEDTDILAPTSTEQKGRDFGERQELEASETDTGAAGPFRRPIGPSKFKIDLAIDMPLSCETTVVAAIKEWIAALTSSYFAEAFAKNQTTRATIWNE